jgi:hypothetical protein
LNARRRAASQPKSFLLFPILLTASRLPHFVCGARYWFDALANCAGAHRARRLAFHFEPGSSATPRALSPFSRSLRDMELIVVERGVPIIRRTIRYPTAVPRTFLPAHGIIHGQF